ncbi:MAG: hypothetical protein ACFFD4_23835 [Candidatus Odinarchaeota archaeon]
MTYISPYIRLLGLKSGKYHQKELLERGFTKEDIKYFDVMIKKFDKLLLDKELRRRFYFFREGVYFVTPEAHLMKLFLTDNTHACVPVEKLVKMGYQDELAFFIKRGWLQVGLVNGTAVCFLGKDACDEPFVHLLAQMLNATNPAKYWPAEITLSGQFKTRLLNSNKQFTSGTTLFLCYTNPDWVVTPDPAVKELANNWFTVKVMNYSDTFKLNLSPAIVTVLLGSGFSNPKQFEFTLDISGQI